MLTSRHRDAGNFTRAAVSSTSSRLSCPSQAQLERSFQRISVQRAMRATSSERIGVWKPASTLDRESAVRPGIDAAVEVDRLTTLGIEKLGHPS
jgi:hypothetical protein